jgi:hypothetical protein
MACRAISPCLNRHHPQSKNSSIHMRTHRERNTSDEADCSVFFFIVGILRHSFSDGAVVGVEDHDEAPPGLAHGVVEIARPGSLVEALDVIGPAA